MPPANDTRLRAGIAGLIGEMPWRMAFAGGWIDQPFVSRLNPEPPGSMVVVALEPTFRWMDRCGMAGGTREVATRLWKGTLPKGDTARLVRELYEEENRGRADPSGSQDMIGLLTPGVSRLDYDADFEGGIFPRHIETSTDPQVARWLESVIRVVPVAPRPDGYNPLGKKNLDPRWIARLGRSGKDCYAAITRRDARALGESMNECMRCWEAILPQTVRHTVVTADLAGILRFYQERYAGAMYSGCGGGYLYVVSEEPVPAPSPSRCEQDEQGLSMGRVFVSGSFDDLRSRGMRFLEEAARLGAVHAYVWPDSAVQDETGRPPKFPQEERLYLVQALRWVDSASIATGVPQDGGEGVWAVDEENDGARQRSMAAARGLRCRVISSARTAGFPPGVPPRRDGGAPAPSAVVTGCFDWLHSGHVRFFEEVSRLGRLYVVVGSDANVRLLKGEGHPMFPQEERRYMAGSIGVVTGAFISTGSGWLDAEPEIRTLRPDIYAVNEDGDKPEKRDFCRDRGIRYVVLTRTPRPGLPARTSTDLRGS